MAFKLPKLPYSYQALEPYIDRKTMQIHHDKHHATYVKNLNSALKGRSELGKLSLEELLKTKIKDQKLALAVKNQGGGHANHSLFWKLMTPRNKGGGMVSEKALEKITSTFGGFENFQELFAASAVGHFGSGWAWLVLEKGKLKIETTPNQDSPLMKGKFPILGIDVWEHAYYLKYQNKRADYVSAWWNVVNWVEVERNFLKTSKSRS